MSAARNLRLEVVLKAVDQFTAPFKGILNQSKAVSKQVSELKNKMKDLDKTQGNIDSFKKLARESAQSSAQLKTAQERATALGRSLAETANPTKKMSAEFNRAKKEAADLSAKHTQLVSKQQSLRTALNSAGIATRNLSQHQRELKQSATSTTAALQKEQQQLEKLGKQSQRMHAAKAAYEKSNQVRDKMAGAGAGMAVAGGGALYAAKRVMAPGLDFDAEMSSVQALTRLEKSGAQLAALRKQARELGAATSFTANEAAQGQGYLAMAGVDPKAIQKAMPGVLDLAKAGRVELPAAADMASNILTGFKLSADQMGRAGDVLVGTFTRSNVDLRMLAESMKYAAPVAAGLGVDLETAAAMTGKLGDAGIQASMGGTALRAIMSRLSAPPAMAAKAMKELGLQAKDAKGNLRDLPTILAELEAKTKNMGNAQRAGYFKHIAGEEAFSALQVLSAQAGSGKLQELIAILKKSAGEASANAATMSDNAAGDIKTLQSAWEDVGIEMFEGSNSPLRELLQNITGVIRQSGEWMKANPILAATLVKVSVSAAAIVAILGGLVLAAAALLGPFAMLRLAMTALNIQMGLGSVLLKVATWSYGLLAGALGMAGNAALFMGRALLMNPIGLMVTAIAIAAFLIYKYWGPISKFFSGLWSAIQEKTGTFWGWLKTSVTTISDAMAQQWQRLKDVTLAVWDSLAGGVMAIAQGLLNFLMNWTPVGFIAEHWQDLKQITFAVWQLIKNGITGLAQGVTDFFMKWSLIGVMVRNWAAICAGANTAWQWLTHIALAAGQAIAGFFMSWSLIGILIRNWDAICASANTAWQWLKNIAIAAGQGIAGFFMTWSLLGIIIRNWDAICASANTAWQWLKNIAIAAGQGIADFFMTWSLLGIIIRNWDSITTFMSGLVTSFVTIGGQIMDGLIQGFLSGIHLLKNAINGVGENAIGWFKEKLGIHSPSRVFAQLGAFTMQGFSNGLTDTQNEPLAAIKGITSKVISAASGLMIGGTSLGAMADIKLDSRPPMASPASYAQGPATSIQIVINAAPGMNEQQLAQLVAQEIAKAERQRQARGRSRLGDND